MGSSSSTRRGSSDQQQPPLRSWASALPPASDGTISGTLGPQFVLRLNNERRQLGLQPQRMGVNQAQRRQPRKTKANAVKNPVNLHKGSLHLVACERPTDGHEQTDESRESGFSVSFLFDTTTPCRIRVLLSASVSTDSPPANDTASQTTPPFTDANGAPHASLTRWWDFEAGFNQSFDAPDLFISRTELISALEAHSMNSKLVPITVSLEALAPAPSETAEVQGGVEEVHAARQDTMATCLDISSLASVAEPAHVVAASRDSGEEEKETGAATETKAETKTAEADGASAVQVPRLQVIMQRISIAGQVFELFELFGRTSSTAVSGTATATLSTDSTPHDNDNDERSDPSSSSSSSQDQQHRTKGTTSTSGGVGPADSEPECVICLSDPPSTILVPCRHVCLCQDCADQLSRDSDKCPVCRAVVQEILTLGPNPSRSEPTPGIGNASNAQYLPSGMAN